MAVADPLFLMELSLEMGIPVGELGRRMTNYELCVLYPAYFAEKERHDEAMRKES